VRGLVPLSAAEARCVWLFCVAGAHLAGVGIWIQRKRSARAGRLDKPQLACTAALAHTRGASRGWR
jgi:hypothetical protein